MTHTFRKLKGGSGEGDPPIKTLISEAKTKTINAYLPGAKPGSSVRAADNING